MTTDPHRFDDDLTVDGGDLLAEVLARSGNDPASSAESPPRWSPSGLPHTGHTPTPAHAVSNRTTETANPSITEPDPRDEPHRIGSRIRPTAIQIAVVVGAVLIGLAAGIAIGRTMSNEDPSPTMQIQP